MPPALVEQIATLREIDTARSKPVAQGSESDSDDEPPALVPQKTKQKQRIRQTIPLKQKKKR